MRIVILGAGEVGTHLARVLSKNAEIILIDRKPEALVAVEDVLDVLTVQGDITHRKVLIDAGVRGAALVVAVTGSDDANLVGAALAAEVGAPRTVARIDDASFYQTASGIEAGVLGIHAALCAARLVGDELIRLITNVDADYVQGFARGSLQVAMLLLKETHPVCGKAAGQVALPKGCSLQVVVRDNQAILPVEITRLEVGDRLILVGPPVPMLTASRQVVGSGGERGLIIGGGDVGLQLAKMLSSCERHVQIIEKNPARAEFLAAELPRANVICGDGSSIATLRDEHIESVDYVAALTRSDEVNLMVSLVARDLGVDETYTLVHRPGYEEVYRHLGVHGTTGPHDVLASAIERLLPQSHLYGASTIPDTPLECVEYWVPESVSRPIPRGRLVLPPGAFLLGSAMSGEGPCSPEADIVAGQTLVIASAPHCRRELEQALKRLGGSA